MEALKLNQLVIDQERLNKLKEVLLNAPQKLDNERLHFLAKIYPEYDGYPSIIRRARLFEYVMLNKTLYIDDNYFVGSLAQYVCGVYAYPEWNCGWMKDKEGKAVSHLGEIKVTEEDRQVFAKIVDYWDSRGVGVNTNRLFEEVFGYSSLPAQQVGLYYDGNSWPAGGGVADYERVVKQGLRQMIEEIRERKADLEIKSYNRKAWNFYEACLIQLEAVVAWANRYADLAESKAQTESKPSRKAELMEIAQICRRVPEFPASNLREAMQSFLLIHLALEIEVTGCGYSIGFLGHIFQPYYAADLANGQATLEEAVYLTIMLYTKLQEIGYYHGPKLAKAWSSHTGQTLCIGGLTPTGEDATCEFDYILCDAHLQFRGIQPPLCLYWHSKLKEDFLFKCLEVIKTGIGHPQIMNTELCVARVLDHFCEDGARLQDARRVATFGCVSNGIAGETSNPVEGEICIAKAFELAFNGGTDPLTGIKIDLQTGNPDEFTSFEQMWEAWKEYVFYGFRVMRGHGQCGIMYQSEVLPLPLRSALIGGCIEKGTDIWDGGAKYTSDLVISVATIDAANCLLAVKDLVFDKKLVTMKELRQACLANFESYEEIQRMCLEAPKHGNDIEEVNNFVYKCYDVVYDAYMAVGRNYMGKQGKPKAYSNSLHNYFGAVSGALPNGREARLALTDGSVSAMPGTDTQGPTALVNSAAKCLDTLRFGSNHFNMKFNPSAVETPQGMRNLANLIAAYFAQNGSHIQFNIVSSETLKDAQMNPDRYKDLVVRVAGFSAYFTRWDPGVQSEIRRRTELTFEG
ncbi:MAG: glycyl radical protein [Clostridia bacterium]|nr:glycyl radical protein [Clostridia bacterium]